MVVDEDSEMADQQPDPRHDSERDEPESPLLLIQADNVGVATVTSLLKTISFCEKVNVFLSEAGIRFVVEEGKYVQAGVLFKAELFRTFSIREEAFGFRIPFKELLDCLKILGGEGKIGAFGGDSVDPGTVIGGGNAPTRSMQITYNGYGSPFCLALDEQGMFTELELKTEDIQPIVDFDEMQKVWEITMDSKLLHEFLFELEGYGADTVALRVIPDTSFQFRAQGQAGSLQISLPRNCSGIERFGELQEEKQIKYKFNILRNSFKLIQAADKVVLQLRDQDVLGVELVFKDTMSAFADFSMLAETMDSSEDDGIDH